MSGSLQDQVQIPSYLRNTTNAYYPSGTGADNPNGQPKDSEKFIRNSSTYYSQDKLSYSIPDKSGNTVKTIYKGGAYITLEDVAAYVYAFGDVPANYDADKSASPSSSPWGKYLRVNNTYFSGRTANSFPYEPNFPDNSSDAGYTVRSAWTQAHEKEYYEIDIGTTGTFEYGGSYRAAVYNNGYKITRGASRIIYTRYLSSGNEISDPNERFVFYTYDHYNDFQEYLNYSEGWGAWFGNLAGGGVQNNSTYVYAQKAPYPEVSRNDL